MCFSATAGSSRLISSTRTAANTPPGARTTHLGLAGGHWAGQAEVAGRHARVATVGSGGGTGLLADLVAQTFSFVTEPLTSVHPTRQRGAAGQSTRDVHQVTGNVAS